MPAHAASRTDGMEKAHAVEAVIHPVGGALDSGQSAIGHGREQRESEEAVRDRPAERGRGRPLGVDMDELLVFGDLGEGVDPPLIDDEPARDEAAADQWPERRPAGTFLTSAQSFIRRSPNIDWRRGDRKAAVDRQDRAGRIGAAASGQEQDRAGDVVRRPSRPIGTVLAPRAAPASSPIAKRVMLVGNGPGAMALIVTCRPANSWARMRVR